MLSDRRQRILSALIEEYVSHALPVGSRTIAEQYKLGVSSATIRNELSVLEEAGYITQPHTSAGRIPTDAGYREFVDRILTSGSFGIPALDSNLVARMKASADALDTLMEDTSKELTNLTECLSVVTAPHIDYAKVRQVSLISLSDSELLAVTVMEDGQVSNRRMRFSGVVQADDLKGIERDISDAFVSKTASEIEISKRYCDMAAKGDVCARIAEEVLNSIRSSKAALKTTSDGIGSLMRMPEFQDSSSLLPIMEILEDDSVLFHIFDSEGASSDSLSIRIGSENSEAGLSGASVVAGMYGRGEAKGVVAVIGPKRMDYTKVISAVRTAQEILGEE